MMAIALLETHQGSLSPTLCEEVIHTTSQRAQCHKVASITSCVAIAIIASAILTVATLVFSVTTGLPLIAVLLLFPAYLLIDRICVPQYLSAKHFEREATELQTILLRSQSLTVEESFLTQNNITTEHHTPENLHFLIALFKHFEQDYTQKYTQYTTALTTYKNNPIALDNLLQQREVWLERRAFVSKIHAVSVLQLLQSKNDWAQIKNPKFEPHSYALRQYWKENSQLTPYFTCQVDQANCSVDGTQIETLSIPALRTLLCGDRSE